MVCVDLSACVGIGIVSINEVGLTVGSENELIREWWLLGSEL